MTGPGLGLCLDVWPAKLLSAWISFQRMYPVCSFPVYVYFLLGWFLCMLKECILCVLFPCMYTMFCWAGFCACLKNVSCVFFSRVCILCSVGLVSVHA